MGIVMGNKIAQFFLLKKFLTKLYRLVDTSRVVGYALSPRARRGYTYFAYDCDETKLGGLPRDVPKGHFVVYVGSERSRFVIPTTYLSHPLFQILLEKAEEEYGFDHQMGLTLPCEEVFFEYITSVLERENPTVTNLELNKIIDSFHTIYKCNTSVY
ncbi:hypothetical protein SUGI_0458500 [Cryptomeria japonica]|uniref:protein SMALL AUXIN UP-REGULATED RNA 54-like n=1 Tax=Cryptomeria japonica TaxID=3369 RepID=UPI002408B53C|nr:protein SMALL AUXIN UP-REGULATED RNA 54-like [Cryptomeria japonica]GLJ24055.1 hypothetical protein SUGI_0458500 [Cryptomeria japonica]